MTQRLRQGVVQRWSRLLAVAFSLLVFTATVWGDGDPLQTGDPGARSDSAAVTQAPSGSEFSLPDYSAALVRTLVTLGVMVVVLLLVARFLPRWLRRFAPPEQGKGISVIESRRLTPGGTLHIVRANDRTLLIGSTAHGMCTLADLGDARAPTAAGLVPRQEFSELLGRRAPGGADAGPKAGPVSPILRPPP